MTATRGLILNINVPNYDILKMTKVLGQKTSGCLKVEGRD